MATSWYEFVERWSQSELREQQAAQSHFNELCQLAGFKTPTEMDPEGKFFTFEENVGKATGGRGRADVWYRGKFAWEYKGKHKDLDAAYAQLLAYKSSLDNPPLLVVCDFLEYRIYPQWPNTSGQPFVFRNADLVRTDTHRYLTWLLSDPEKFLELRNEELKQREAITFDLANQFAHLAGLMRDHKNDEGKPVWEPIQIARFLTRLTFCLFAEDVGLMPRLGTLPVFRYLTEGAWKMPIAFTSELQTLFEAMDGQRSHFIMEAVPYFNGGLFADSQPGAGDGKEVLDLTEIPGAIDLLEKVSEADWRRVNPTIFGTLFEGALDENKRAQLGAHYTSEEDIRLVVEPVLMEPLNRLWAEIQAEAEPLLQKYLKGGTPRATQEAQERLVQLHDQMMSRLEQTRVLDPACGSGNFLYMSLRAMKDLEARARKFFEPLGLRFRDVVTPRQLYGIEKDEFAARLAQVVVWIGYLQWRYEDEGMLHPRLKSSSRPHPKELPHPILQDKYHPDEPDHIQCADAILRYDAEGKPYEPEWPEVDVIMGNPPFLGGSRLRSELGDQYLENLWRLYEGRLPGFSDLVCYWFERARLQIEQGKARRAGLLATNSIRGGANRVVLERIKQTGDIFMAWSDRPWVLEGAAVRISIVGFDAGTQKIYMLDGDFVSFITPDLQRAVDITAATHLSENIGISFMGPSPKAPFDIPASLAQKMLAAPLNVNGRPNSDVIRPVASAVDIVQKSRQEWTIDFALMSQEEAAQYSLPFEYVKQYVYPVRSKNRRLSYAEKWWQYAESRPGMRAALKGCYRFIATPAVAKHRIFVWMAPEVLCNQGTLVFARSDDYFFGALHAYPHEIWSLRKGTSLEDRPRYTPTTTFETYPFPWAPGKEDIASAAHEAISAAAKQLHEEREGWLNPSDLLALGADSNGKTLQERTLTNLYNALAAYRAGNANGEKITKSARDFAPRLATLHDALDAAVLAAYGWSDLVGKLRTPEGDQELLRRLLALNVMRAG